MEDKEHTPKFKHLIVGLNDLTLGISMVVAVLIGVGIGYGLKSLFGIAWLFWIGVFLGVCAAILNVHKAYKRQQRDLQELENNPRYTYKQTREQTNES